MANLVLAFAELLGGAIILDAGIKGDSIANVVKGQATQNPINPPAAATTSSGAVGQGLTSIGTSGGGSSTNIPPGTYTNPVPGASPSRIDEGGDYTLGPQGFLAPGRSKIVATSGSFFRGGTVVAQLLDGPLAGQYYYVAEGIAPAPGITVGAIVPAGARLTTSIASPYNGTVGNIEAGWASASGIPLAQSTGGYIEGHATAAGVAWNNFVKSLGGVADTANTAIMGALSGVLAGL